MIYLGIDPGKSGGIVAITNLIQPPSIYLYESVFSTWRWLKQFEPRHTTAVIEFSSASPQMGVTSAFHFGENYGALVALLTAAEISFSRIRPQVWQRAIGISQRKKGESKHNFKKRLLRIAQERFPKLSIWEKPLTVQLAICDALLIALFNYQTHTNPTVPG